MFDDPKFQDGMNKADGQTPPQTTESIPMKPTTQPVNSIPQSEVPVGAPMAAKSGGSVMKIVLLFVVVLVVIAAAVMAGLWFFDGEKIEDDNDSDLILEERDAPVEVIEEPQDNPESVTNEIPLTPIVSDLDGDGLTDAEEAQLGTAADKVDTDNDGLTDFQETRVYRTNPLNRDSDNDTYIDGDEVNNGYDPNGPGKLLNL
ncbi:TPA: hypothetical protein DF272_04910 [Candidatus Falkowbacteria bacterium]|nr:hypothetical protein [Candidatus Falkowbacteria bacterium]